MTECIKYISRQDTLDYIENEYCMDCEHSDGVLCKDCHYEDCMDIIRAMSAADVQPVNQWISVKDRLPEPGKEVLVWYRYTWGAGFTSYRFGISKWYSNIKRWYEGCLPKDIEVLYWQPLPEPPKDGDLE